MSDPHAILGRAVLGRMVPGRGPVAFEGPERTRWSAGAMWSDDSSTTALWEDEADWPIPYDDANPPELSVFLGGYDVTLHCQSASWQLGQSDLWAAPSVSSASVTLRPEAVALADAIGARLLIMSAVDALWWGTVEAATEAFVPTDNDARPSDSITLAAVDGLQLTDEPGPGLISGPPARVISALLSRGPATVPVTIVGPEPTHADTDAPYRVRLLGWGDEAGPAREAAFRVADGYGLALAWGPLGLRAATRALITDDTAGFIEDAHTMATRRSLTRDVKTVRNTVLLTDDGEPYATVRDTASTGPYGRRDLPDVPIDSLYEVEDAEQPQREDFVTDVWVPIVDAWAQPVEAYAAGYVILDGTDAIHRALPFDVISEGETDAYLLTSLRHTADIGSYRVEVDGVRVALAEA